MPLPKRKSERGYTLIEALVGMSVLAVVLTPMLAFMGNFLKDRHALDLLSAASIAEQEQVRIICDEMPFVGVKQIPVNHRTYTIDEQNEGTPYTLWKLSVSCDSKPLYATSFSVYTPHE